jgi:membrane protein
LRCCRRWGVSDWLAFASILGFVRDNDPGFQRRVLDSTLKRMPLIGRETWQINGEVGTLTGSGVALAFDLAGAIWTGLGGALDRISAVPRTPQRGYLSSRWRGLLVLASFWHHRRRGQRRGRAGGGRRRGIVAIEMLGRVASAVVDLMLFAATFQLLTAVQVTIRRVLPGALLVSSCWLGLQALGGVVVTQVLAGSSQSYGGFAAVVGLLSWLLTAAELKVVLADGQCVADRRVDDGGRECTARLAARCATGRSRDLCKA